jgi:hypothetical protein
MDPCVVDWSAVAEWTNVAISFLALVLGVIVILMWRVQLRGGTRHQAAHAVAEAAKMLQYAFYDARSPFISAGEFPASYRMRAPGAPVTHEDRAAEYRHAYANRFQVLWTHILALANLRPRAGVALGDAVADAAERLAKVARQLDWYMTEHVAQLRAGPETVAGWQDQQTVVKVEAGVTVDAGRNDAYSREFEKALNELLELVKQHM